MPTLSFTIQNVNGDPFTNGGNINITTGTTSDVVFTEFATISLSNVAGGDTITIGGLVYQYDYLGSHDVRGDPLQPAAYIRIVGPLPAGATLPIGETFAIDLTGEPGDADYPNLKNGNTKGSVPELDSTSPINFPGTVCFAKGTMILTLNGAIAVEHLRVGDYVETLDSDIKPIIWIGSTKLSFEGDNEKQKPVLITAGALGADAPLQDLAVSPQHKVLLIDVNGGEALAPAKGLTSHPGIRIMNGRKEVEYFHVLLPAHSLIFAEGLATESFYPGAMAMKMLSAKQARDIRAILPALTDDPASYGPKARTSLTRKQTEQLPQNIRGLGVNQSFLALQCA